MCLVYEPLEMLDQVLARRQQPAVRDHPRGEAELNGGDERRVLQAYLVGERHHLLGRLVRDLLVEEVLRRARAAARAGRARHVD